MTQNSSQNRVGIGVYSAPECPLYTCSGKVKRISRSEEERAFRTLTGRSLVHSCAHVRTSRVPIAGRPDGWCAAQTRLDLAAFSSGGSVRDCPRSAPRGCRIGVTAPVMGRAFRSGFVCQRARGRSGRGVFAGLVAVRRPQRERIGVGSVGGRFDRARPTITRTSRTDYSPSENFSMRGSLDRAPRRNGAGAGVLIGCRR